MFQTVFITGSTRGIGKAIAWRFAQEKWRVILNGVNRHRHAEILLRQIRQLSPLSELFFFDVSNQQETYLNCKAILKKFKKIDVLVNNAGIREDALLINMTVSQWDKVIRNNLYSVFFVTKNILPNMIKYKSGKIINISSITGVSGGFGQTNYAASKGGMIGFTKSLAKEVARYNIAVNTICPGLVDTDFITGVPAKYIKNMLSKTATGQKGKPDEIADFIYYLA